MIRITTWGGLVTYASPYILPAGGTTSQINFSCLQPGQIQCRGGMQDTGTNAANSKSAQEMWGWTVGNDTQQLFIFDGDGNIQIVKAPDV
tara:strand:+ start:1120 stop:1389 length:270 start_codon:yes stop_codon:yes gene_type:complete